MLAYSDVLSSDSIDVQCTVMVQVECVYGTDLATSSMLLSKGQGKCISDVPGACCGCVRRVMPASVHIDKRLCLPVHAGSQPS